MPAQDRPDRVARESCSTRGPYGLFPVSARRSLTILSTHCRRPAAESLEALADQPAAIPEHRFEPRAIIARSRDDLRCNWRARRVRHRVRPGRAGEGRPVAASMPDSGRPPSIMSPAGPST